jgi:hypothetical protein
MFGRNRNRLRQAPVELRERLGRDHQHGIAVGEGDRLRLRACVFRIGEARLAFVDAHQAQVFVEHALQPRGSLVAGIDGLAVVVPDAYLLCRAAVGGVDDERGVPIG